MPSIVHLLTHTIWVAPVEGAGLNYGDPVYGTPCSMLARVDRKVDTFRDDNGNERSTQHLITTDTPIERGSMIWFDQCHVGDSERGFEVLLVERSRTPDGTLEIWSCRV